LAAVLSLHPRPAAHDAQFDVNHRPSSQACNTNDDKNNSTRVVCCHSPITRTTPSPFGNAIASTCADSIARTDSATAVSNPNERSTSGMSLSIVFGTTATVHASARLRTSCATRLAPRIVPSPPMT
jgi:hypothetical protein